MDHGLIVFVIIARLVVAMACDEERYFDYFIRKLTF